MDRRTFMSGVTLGLLAAPRVVAAQPAGKVYHVGLLSIGSDPTWRIPWKPFIEAMSEMGYVEGRNLLIRPAFADGSPERLPALVAELVSAKVDTIVTTGPRETVAAKRATALIPIVMTVVPDPVAQGFVASLSRPGGNVTGLTNFVPGLGQKYVELLREVLPSATRFAVVASSPNPLPETRQELEAAGRLVGITLSVGCRARTTLTALSLGPRGTGCRHHRYQRRGDVAPPQIARAIGTEAPAARYLLGARVCGRWRSHDVQRERGRPAATGRDLRRQDPQGGQARRPPRRAADL